MEEGYEFHWEAHKAPYLVTPDGGCILLTVNRNIPFLDNSDAAFSLCPSLAIERGSTKPTTETISMVGANIESPEQESVDEPDGTIGLMPGENDNAEKEEDKPKGASKCTSKLKEEATSLVHKLTHLPKNLFCEACKRGKMKEKYSRRGAFKHVLEKWG